MKHTKRTNSFICIAMFVACFTSVATLIGGAVLCQDAGGASIEFTCSHDHCGETPFTDHDSACSEGDGCQCVSCPCEDSPLIIDMVRTPNQREFGLSSVPLPFAFICLHIAPPYSHHSAPLEHHTPPRVNVSLAQRQTVVLLV